MALQKFKRKDAMIGHKESYISIRPGTVAFNSEFVKMAELEKYKRVTVFIDSKNYIIGFQFHNNEKDPDSFTLYSDSKTKSTRNISNQQIIKSNKWIKAILKFEDTLLKRFKPEFDNIKKMWIIHLIPPFENKVSNISKIPSEKKGIYRYLKDDEIVYIGKGIIKSRANSPERTTWEFDTIEYSIVEDPDKQAYWESYWLDRFVEENNRLPLYNKLSGKKIKNNDI